MGANGMGGSPLAKRLPPIPLAPTIFRALTRPSQAGLYADAVSDGSLTALLVTLHLLLATFLPFPRIARRSMIRRPLFLAGATFTRVFPYINIGQRQRTGGH